MQKLNIFLGTFVVNRIEATSTVQTSAFVLLILLLFFLFRMTQMNNVQNSIIRILTLMVNLIGMLFCLFYIIYPFIFEEADAVKTTAKDYDITITQEQI